MRRAARAAHATAGEQPVSPRLVALRTFDVWHREQLVTVPRGEVRDAALIVTLRGIHDASLLEWRA